MSNEIIKADDIQSRIFTIRGMQVMLSSVLKSESAVGMSIQIMRAFVLMCHFMFSNKQIFQRLTNVEKDLAA